MYEGRGGNIHPLNDVHFKFLISLKEIESCNMAFANDLKSFSRSTQSKVYHVRDLSMHVQRVQLLIIGSFDQFVIESWLRSVGYTQIT